jgi:hypothetical protein
MAVTPFIQFGLILLIFRLSSGTVVNLLCFESRDELYCFNHSIGVLNCQNKTNDRQKPPLCLPKTAKIMEKQKPAAAAPERGQLRRVLVSNW